MAFSWLTGLTGPVSLSNISLKQWGSALLTLFLLSCGVSRLFPDHHVTDNTIDSRIAGNGEVSIVKLEGEGCGACKHMTPEINKANETLYSPLTGKGAILTASLADKNWHPNPETAKIYAKYEPRAFPTNIVVGKDGKLVGEFTGYKNAEQLIEAQQLLQKCVPNRGKFQIEEGWFKRLGFWDYGGNEKLRAECDAAAQEPRNQYLMSILEPKGFHYGYTTLGEWGSWALAGSLCCGVVYWKWDKIKACFEKLGTNSQTCEDGCCDDQHATKSTPVATAAEQASATGRKDPKSKGSSGKSTAKTIFLILAIVCALGMLGLGFWYFKRKSANEEKDVFAQLEDIRQQREGEENLDDAPQETPEEPEKTEGEILCETITTETDLYE